MTEDEMKTFLTENADAIKSAVRDKLITGILQEYRWDVTEAVGKAVNEWIKAEIVPDVITFLSGEKASIVAAAQEGARQIGEVMTKHMVETATKNLTGHNFGEIIQRMFRGY